MKRRITRFIPLGFRCLIVLIAISAVGFSALGSALGFSQIPQPKKAEAQVVPACEQLKAAQAPSDLSGAMTPKPKPYSGPVISVVAPIMTKTEASSGKLSRNLNAVCAFHYVYPLNSLHRASQASLSVASPILAHSRTLVGSRPSGTM
jgi:hypothetical protein